MGFSSGHESKIFFTKEPRVVVLHMCLPMELLASHLPNNFLQFLLLDLSHEITKFPSAPLLKYTEQIKTSVLIKIKRFFLFLLF